MYHDLGFGTIDGNFIGWKSFKAKLLTMKPVDEHAQLVSELTR